MEEIITALERHAQALWWIAKQSEDIGIGSCIDVIASDIERIADIIGINESLLRDMDRGRHECAV
ncbi:MAG: hypothetical protein JXK05_03925 [Campylobacterales bacterium]|nr:hypothetical protein [Campylobacterales bacterium]